MVIPFVQQSEKKEQTGLDALARQNQSRGGRNGKSTYPDRIGNVS